MAGRADIPLAFNVEPKEALKRDLERFASGIDALVRNLPADYVERNKSATRAVITSAAFGQVNRAGPRNGETQRIQLPRPDLKNTGREIMVSRTTTTGTVILDAIGCLVNGSASFGMRQHIHFVRLMFDGENYYTNDPGCVGWDGTVTP